MTSTYIFMTETEKVFCKALRTNHLALKCNIVPASKTFTLFLPLFTCRCWYCRCDQSFSLSSSLEGGSTGNLESLKCFYTHLLTYTIPHLSLIYLEVLFCRLWILYSEMPFQAVKSFGNICFYFELKQILPQLIKGGTACFVV